LTLVSTTRSASTGSMTNTRRAISTVHSKSHVWTLLTKSPAVSSIKLLSLPLRSWC